MTTRALLDPPAVARALARNVEWFTRNERRLMAEHGFPARVKGCGRRWDPAAIDAWLDAQLPPHLRDSVRRVPAGDGPGEAEIADGERRLLARFGAAA